MRLTYSSNTDRQPAEHSELSDKAFGNIRQAVQLPATPTPFDEKGPFLTPTSRGRNLKRSINNSRGFQ